MDKSVRTKKWNQPLKRLPLYIDPSSPERSTRCRTLPRPAATTCWSCTPSSTRWSSSCSSPTSSQTPRRRTSTKAWTQRRGRVLDSRLRTFQNLFTPGLCPSCGQVPLMLSSFFIANSSLFHLIPWFLNLSLLFLSHIFSLNVPVNTICKMQWIFIFKIINHFLCC